METKDFRTAAEILYPNQGNDDNDVFDGWDDGEKRTAADILYPNQGADNSANTDEVPGWPNEYRITFNEGTEVDQELLSRFQRTAHELKIKPSQAQKLAAMYEAHMAKLARG